MKRIRAGKISCPDQMTYLISQNIVTQQLFSPGKPVHLSATHGKNTFRMFKTGDSIEIPFHPNF